MSKNVGAALAQLEKTRQSKAGRVEQRREQVDAAATLPRQMPLFSDELRAISNDLARSPLFSPIRPGRRKLRDDQLASPAGVSIHYKGEQLDQSDCDVFMQLVHTARGKTIGTEHPVAINRSELLSQIGRADGGKNYEWLGNVLTRLQQAHLRVENQRYKLETNLVSKIITDKQEGTFLIVLDHDIVKMFSGNEHTLVDWDKRKLIERRVDLAKWLQSFTCSHARGQQRWVIKNLREWSGYASPVRKFREALLEALEELERVGVLSGAAFYERDAKVRWQRL